MIRSWWKRVVLLLLCIGLSSVWSYQIRRSAHGKVAMIDFGEIYYGARCVLHHADPYNPSTVLKEFQDDGGKFSSAYPGGKIARIVITIGVNLPTTLFLAAPMAMLPWEVAQTVWVALIAGFLALAAYLVWDLGANCAPFVWACMVGFMLANCEQLLSVGNAAGIAVSLCIVAAWCFLRQRHELIGVTLLAVSLVLKPHDAGFVWLYFLIAGGVPRKRALQTLAVVGVIGLCSAIWIAPASPHWMQELHQNLAIVSANGGTSDPSLLGITSKNAGQIIDLQAAISVLQDNAHVYNLLSYAICGPLILVWLFAVVRKPPTSEGSLFALAAISVLSILPVYHRPYDAKILMLTLPACAMLWTGRQAGRWLALLLTSAGILLTSDIPLALLLAHARTISTTASTLDGKIAILLWYQQTPLVLLAMGSYYLWLYVRYKPHALAQPQEEDSMLGLQMSTAM